MFVGSSINDIKITIKSYAYLSYWQLPQGSLAPGRPDVRREQHFWGGRRAREDRAIRGSRVMPWPKSDGVRILAQERVSRRRNPPPRSRVNPHTHLLYFWMP